MWQSADKELSESIKEVGSEQLISVMVWKWIILFILTVVLLAMSGQFKRERAEQLMKTYNPHISQNNYISNPSLRKSYRALIEKKVAKNSEYQKEIEQINIFFQIINTIIIITSIIFSLLVLKLFWIKHKKLKSDIYFYCTGICVERDREVISTEAGGHSECYISIKLENDKLIRDISINPHKDKSITLGDRVLLIRTNVDVVSSQMVFSYYIDSGKIKIVDV